MANVVVVGAQWGDEGKGKIVDWLSARAEIVVRFQGGHNAGHTLVVNGETYKFSLLPSGVIRKGARALIGAGVVVDPWALLDEITALRQRGIDITPERLGIADNAALILPVHRELDALREEHATAPIGTTKRGIGPAYEDKVGRRAVRLSDLADSASLDDAVGRLLLHHNTLRRGMGEPEIEAAPLVADLKKIAPQILPFAAPVWKILREALDKSRRILFEGAQGALLDVDYGTYPYVTSSNTLAGQAATGAGVGPGAIDYVLGIVKAYTTRVGEGPFPTEQNNETGAQLARRGREFGTVTGRSRRCGWFDAALLRASLAVNGVDGIALTKLDVLDGFDEIKICTHYTLDGKQSETLPATTRDQNRVAPVYESLPGWQTSTRGATSWKDLPAEAVKYVRRLEELINAPVALLSTSPQREDTILIRDPFAHH